jgi:hypothetical protein
MKYTLAQRVMFGCFGLAIAGNTFLLILSIISTITGGNS